MAPPPRPLSRKGVKPSSSAASERFVVANSYSEDNSFSTSDDDEDEDEEEWVSDDGEAEDDKLDKGGGGGGAAAEAAEDEERQSGGFRGKKARLTISLKTVCRVCKRTGHTAGFRGHTTVSCPHRVAMEHGVIPAGAGAGAGDGARTRTRTRIAPTSLDYVFHRQLNPKLPLIKAAFVIPNQVDCGIIRFHSRRVTCLEFHSTKNNLLLSGDKLGIWDYGKLHEKTVYGSIHSYLVNSIKFSSKNDGAVYTASSDGKVSSTDIETGIPVVLLDLNPDGWSGPATWQMLYGMDSNSEKGLLLVADNFGYLHLLDERSKMRVGEPVLIHKKGTKVAGLHCNPIQQDLLLSCGNDHFGRIWDIRYLEVGCSLTNIAHGRVVNSAYFSLTTGSKILTTSQDNRLQVWDSIFGTLDFPSRQIVHSHDFNRHLTPFRAEWDPKDPSESLVVIGRSISENYNGVALHPIDFIDTSTGTLVAEVIEPDITTISPVNKLHPRVDILASGSSRSLFIWRPKRDLESTEGQQERKSNGFVYSKSEKKVDGNFDGESDDDSGFLSKGKSQKGTLMEKVMMILMGKSQKNGGKRSTIICRGPLPCIFFHFLRILRNFW